MTSHHAVVDRWVDNILGKTDKAAPRGSRVFPDGDRIFSYGYHFELGRLLRTPKGAPRAFLLNGERYSSSTTGHQALVRGAAQRSGLPTAIIPYEALRAAGVDRDSIVPVDISQDRNEQIVHTSTTEPDYYTSAVTQPDGSTLYTWFTYRHWLGESLVKARVDKRTAYFLSGFDMQERTPLYFFCELPRKARPTTIAEAYEVLKPQAVKLAESVGRPVYRQGDIFAIPMASVDTRTLKRAGAVISKRGPLLKTNHVATEVAYLPDGTTLVRGVLYHVPAWRDPDHARRSLGKGWHVVIKNTVPTAA